MSLPPSATVSRPRLYYLDWLRVFSMAAVFLYHSNRFFNSGDWHVKNPQLSEVSTIVEGFMGIWLMPTLFVLSGAAIFYSLKSRSAGEFVKERFLRILIPLITLGIFVLGPWQIYLERFTHGQFSGSFWQFLPQYFNGAYGFGGNFAWMGVHLWYLMLLFMFSMLFLGLFLPSRKSGVSLLTKISSPFDHLWAILLLCLPLILALNLADALGMEFTRQMGGWDTFSYMLFLLYGYLLVANPRAMETIRKYAFLFLILALAVSLFMLVMAVIVNSSIDTGYFFKDEMRSVDSWLWILAFLGLGSRFLTANNRFLSHANEAVLPFYVLHQPVILPAGYFVVQWSLPVAAKYSIIAAVSFIAIMILYEFLVRRVNVLRFLFGMRLTRTVETPKAAVAGAGVR